MTAEIQNRGNILIKPCNLLAALVMAAVLAACTSAGTEGGRVRRERMLSSPFFHDGKFQNLVPTTLMTWASVTRYFGDEKRVPDAPLPVVTPARSLLDTAPASGLRITWLGHSTALVEMDGYRILTDPVFSKRASPLGWAGPARFHPVPLPISDLPSIDVVLISHDHYDHLDRASILDLAPKVRFFVVPLGIGGHLEEWEVPQDRIIELDWWQDTVFAPGLRLAACPARHYSGRSLLGLDRDKTQWSSWAIIGPQHRIFYSGDTGMLPTFAEIGKRFGPFDATLIKIGAYDESWPDIQINPEEAVSMHEMVRGKLLIPVHWGTFNLGYHDWFEPPERLLAASRKAGISAVVPRTGEPVVPEATFDQHRWWLQAAAEAKP